MEEPFRHPYGRLHLGPRAKRHHHRPLLYELVHRRSGLILRQRPLHYAVLHTRREPQQFLPPQRGARIRRHMGRTRRHFLPQYHRQPHLTYPASMRQPLYRQSRRRKDGTGEQCILQLGPHQRRLRRRRRIVQLHQQLLQTGAFHRHQEFPGQPYLLSQRR